MKKEQRSERAMRTGERAPYTGSPITLRLTHHHHTEADLGSCIMLVDLSWTYHISSIPRN